MTATRVHLLVSGRVQGVAYRASAVIEARRLGLSGWIRNRFDGTVEIEAEGPLADVEAFTAWARRGPAAARVKEVVVSRSSPTGVVDGFQVGSTG